MVMDDDEKRWAARPNIAHFFDYSRQDDGGGSRKDLSFGSSQIEE